MSKVFPMIKKNLLHEFAAQFVEKSCEINEAIYKGTF